jgi:ribosome-associated translation inhibitor RaiA
MTVNFEYVGVDVSETLSAFTEEKLKKLFDRYEFLISATVYFKLDENKHETGKICNIELSLPGPRRETINDLERQIKKRKEVYKTH